VARPQFLHRTAERGVALEQRPADGEIVMLQCRKGSMIAAIQIIRRRRALRGLGMLILARKVPRRRLGLS
jgi:hypothetical protein